MLRGQTKILKIYRNSGSGYAYVSTLYGDLQEDNKARETDNRIMVSGLFNQAWASLKEGTDIQFADKLIDSDVEYFVQNVVPPNGVKGRHIEVLLKRNSLNDPGRAETIQRLTVDGTQSTYDDILDEYIDGDTVYTTEDVNGIIMNYTGLDVHDESGGKYPRGTINVFVEKDSLEFNDLLKIRGRNYRVDKIMSSLYFVDEVYCIESSR